MTSEETIDYFDLLIEVAKKVAETIPEGSSPKVFYRRRIQQAWHELNSYMSSAFPDIATAAGQQWSLRLTELLAALARECTMATWYLGIQVEDGEDGPEVVAGELAKLTAEAKIRL